MNSYSNSYLTELADPLCEVSFQWAGIQNLKILLA